VEGYVIVIEKNKNKRYNTIEIREMSKKIIKIVFLTKKLYILAFLDM